MAGIGAHETLIPLLHLNVAERNDNHQTQSDHLIFDGIKDRVGRSYNLAASPEQMYMNLMRLYDLRANDLPIQVFQFGTKFRDETHTLSLLRLKQFTMMDSYSFHLNKNSFEREYVAMLRCFEDIFSEINLNLVIIKTLNAIAPDCYAHEVVIESDSGESPFCLDTSKRSAGFHVDYIKSHNIRDGYENEVRNGIEIGNTYEVGYRFTSGVRPLQVKVGSMRRPVYMGAYSIGIERTIVAAIEKNSDEFGVVWPKVIAPFEIVIVNGFVSAEGVVQSLYEHVSRYFRVLLDDRVGIELDEQLETALRIGIPIILQLESNNPQTISVITRPGMVKQLISFENIDRYLGIT